MTGPSILVTVAARLYSNPAVSSDHMPPPPTRDVLDWICQQAERALSENKVRPQFRAGTVAIGYDPDPETMAATGGLYAWKITAVRRRRDWLVNGLKEVKNPPSDRVVWVSTIK